MRGISQKELSRQTGIPYTALNEVLNCKRAITTEYALLIEAALGIESDFWHKNANGLQFADCQAE